MGMLQLQAALSSFTTVFKKRIQKCTAGTGSTARTLCCTVALHPCPGWLSRMVPLPVAGCAPLGCMPQEDKLLSNWSASGKPAAQHFVFLRRESIGANPATGLCNAAGAQAWTPASQSGC